jgi:hypothetical protein
MLAVSLTLLLMLAWDIIQSQVLHHKTFVTLFPLVLLFFIGTFICGVGIWMVLGFALLFLSFRREAVEGSLKDIHSLEDVMHECKRFLRSMSSAASGTSSRGQHTGEDVRVQAEGVRYVEEDELLAEETYREEEEDVDGGGEEGRMEQDRRGRGEENEATKGGRIREEEEHDGEVDARGVTARGDEDAAVERDTVGQTRNVGQKKDGEATRSAAASGKLMCRDEGTVNKSFSGRGRSAVEIDTAVLTSSVRRTRSRRDTGSAGASDKSTQEDFHKKNLENLPSVLSPPASGRRRLRR